MQVIVARENPILYLQKDITQLNIYSAQYNCKLL